MSMWKRFLLALAAAIPVVFIVTFYRRAAELDPVVSHGFTKPG